MNENICEIIFKYRDVWDFFYVNINVKLHLILKSKNFVYYIQR